MRLKRTLLASALAFPLCFLQRPAMAQTIPPASAGNITNYAGTGLDNRVPGTPPATGVSANITAFRTPDGLAMNAAGDLYIADKNDNVVRKVDYLTGNVTTIAGNGTAGFSGDGGAAISAELDGPVAVAVDSAGNVYIVDYNNHRVRKVDTSNNISTFAGNGTLPAGTGLPTDNIGDGGAATAASIDPHAVAVNAADDVFIVDQNHRLIRKVDHSTGNISTFAGVLYTRGYLSTAEGGPANAMHFDTPKALAFDGAGTTLYIADQYGHRIFKVDPSNNINTFAGTGGGGTGRFSGDGGQATVAELDSPAGLAVDGSDVYITDQHNFRIRKVAASGIITTVAGDGTALANGGQGPVPGDNALATNAQLNTFVAGLAVHASVLYIADYGNAEVRSVNLTAAPTAQVTLASDVAGATFTVGGNYTACQIGTYPASTALTWTQGAECSVTVSIPTGYTYSGWLDAPAAANPRVFTAPGGTTTYTAHFDPTPPNCASNSSLSPTSVSISDAAANGSVTVTSLTGCPWTPASNAAWLTVTAGGSGSGSGPLTFHADANTATAARTGILTIAAQTFTVTQAGVTVTPPPPPPVVTGLRFIPVAPCRIADTRDPAGPFGAPRLEATTTRNFEIPQQSTCGIPAGAEAYSLNFTVVPTGKLDYITVFPTGQTMPLASTVNSYDGRVKANAAIVPAGANGAISVYATDATQVIIDVNGYFVPATNTSALAFFPMAPCRVTDTRYFSGPLGTPALSGGGERIIPVLTSSCQIPSTAQAYSFNYTVVPKKPLEYLTTWPTGSTRPLVSTLNAPTGTITANAAIVPKGSNGDVSVYVTDDTELLIDINGYFAPPASGGLQFHKLDPCRIMDTRAVSGAQPLVNTLGVTVGGVCNAPANAQSYVFNSTVVPVEPLLYLTLWPHGAASQPEVSTLNAPDGTVTSNLAIVPSSDGMVNAFAPSSTHLILDIFGYFAP